MRRFLTVMAASAMAAFAATATRAAVVDVVAEAAPAPAGGGERGIANGAAFSSPNFGGLNLMFTSFDGASDGFFPYFDDLFNNNPGGLGVCQLLDSDEASDDPADDNVQTGEGVRIDFLDGLFDVSSLSFTNGNHNPVNSSAHLVIATSGMAATVMSFMMASNMTFSSISWIRFDFFTPQQSAGEEFYVNGFATELIPAPGALPLLPSGFAGLGFAILSRRYRRA